MSRSGSTQKYLEYEQQHYCQILARISDIQKEIKALEKDETNLTAQQSLQLSISRAALCTLKEIEHNIECNVRRLYLRINMYGYEQE